MGLQQFGKPTWKKGGRVKKIENREGFPDIGFQEVEGHKHNFVSLRIPDVS
jgi:hypothetical protein